MSDELYICLAVMVGGGAGSLYIVNAWRKRPEDRNDQRSAREALAASAVLAIFGATLIADNFVNIAGSALTDGFSLSRTLLGLSIGLTLSLSILTVDAADKFSTETRDLISGFKAAKTVVICAVAAVTLSGLINAGLFKLLCNHIN